MSTVYLRHPDGDNVFPLVESATYEADVWTRKPCRPESGRPNVVAESRRERQTWGLTRRGLVPVGDQTCWHCGGHVDKLYRPAGSTSLGTCVDCFTYFLVEIGTVEVLER